MSIVNFIEKWLSKSQSRFAAPRFAILAAPRFLTWGEWFYVFNVVFSLQTKNQNLLVRKRGGAVLNSQFSIQMRWRCSRRGGLPVKNRQLIGANSHFPGRGVGCAETPIGACRILIGILRKDCIFTDRTAVFTGVSGYKSNAAVGSHIGKAIIVG